MKEELEQVVRRLQYVRSRMEEYIQEAGGQTTGCSTMLDFVNTISGIPNFSQIYNGGGTFEGNTDLERIPECINSQAFTSMYKFAKGCTGLKKVERLYTGNVTTFVYAFHGCTVLEEIEGMLTDNATTLGECFHGCSSLVRIGSPLNVGNIVSQMDTTFTGCSNLEYLRFSGELRVDIWLSGAPKLSVESLQSVIDSLADLASDGASAKKITFGAKNKAKLSEDQLESVSSKGWTLG